MPNANGMSCLMPNVFCDAPLFVTMATDVVLTLAVAFRVVFVALVVTLATVVLSGFMLDVVVTGTMMVEFSLTVELVHVSTVTGTVTVTVDVTVASLVLITEEVC